MDHIVGSPANIFKRIFSCIIIPRFLRCRWLALCSAIVSLACLLKYIINESTDSVDLHPLFQGSCINSAPITKDNLRNHIGELTYCSLYSISTVLELTTEQRVKVTWALSVRQRETRQFFGSCAQEIHLSRVTPLSIMYTLPRCRI